MAVAAHERSPQAGHAGAMKDPVCGMTVDPQPRSTGASTADAPTTSARRAAREVRGRAGEVPSGRSAQRPSRDPRTPSTPARCIPRSSRSAWATARSAAWRSSRRRSPRGGRSERRISRHASAFLGQRRVAAAAADLGDGRASAGAGSRHPSADGALASAGARDAGRALGWWPIFKRCWASFRQAQPEHVDFDRDRRRRGLPVQRGRDDRARDLPGGLPWPRGRGRRYFEAAAVITALVLLGQVLEIRARERTSGAIKALLGLAPRPRAACVTTAPTRRCRSRRSRSATACGCARATRSRSTAKLSKGAARSTNRC